MPQLSSGSEPMDLKAFRPNGSKMPAIMPLAMPLGMSAIRRSNWPVTPMASRISAAVKYAPTASLTGMAGNSVIRSAVPGADQAVMTGMRSFQLRKMPASPAPMEMPQTQEANMALLMCAAWAAW